MPLISPCALAAGAVGDGQAKPPVAQRRDRGRQGSASNLEKFLPKDTKFREITVHSVWEMLTHESIPSAFGLAARACWHWLKRGRGAARCIAILRHAAAPLLRTNRPVDYNRGFNADCRCMGIFRSPLRSCRRQLRKSSLLSIGLNSHCSNLHLHGTVHTFNKGWNWIKIIRSCLLSLKILEELGECRQYRSHFVSAQRRKWELLEGSWESGDDRGAGCMAGALLHRELRQLLLQEAVLLAWGNEVTLLASAHLDLPFVQCLGFFRVEAERK